MKYLVVIAIVGIVLRVILKRAGQASPSWQEVADRLGVRASTFGLRQRNRLSGTFDGFDVRVHTNHRRGTGSRAHTFTSYRVRYPSLRLGLKLRRQDAFSGIAKLLGADDQVIGHEKFDDAVVIGGRSLAAVRRFLTPERRRSILRALHLFSSLKITDTEITYTARGSEPRDTRLEGRVRQLCDLARVLSREGGPTFGPRHEETGKPGDREAAGLAREA